MKKKSSAKPAKKAAPSKKPAGKSAKPKNPAAKKPASTAGETATRRAGPAPYTPPPVQGVGWAPFRYPPQ